MATYYPEGECYFVRGSLRYGTFWSAENTDQFYNHVLLEYYWNGWRATGQRERSHARSTWAHGTPQGTSTTRFGDWTHFFVGESRTKSPDNMLRIHSHPNSLNWNECRDHNRGGPRKYILRPVRIYNTNTEWLWIDATIPLRAIYFPVSQRTDQAFPHLCTYVVIDFRHRGSLQMRNLQGQLQTFTLDSYNGLGWRDDITWGFNIPNIIAYLAIPHKLRNPAYNLFTPKSHGEELVVCATADRRWGGNTSVLQHQNFIRQMDFANILSATFGVEVGWRPYQHSSFLRDILVSLTQLGLGFVPGVGPILSVAFGMAVQLIIDPDSFSRDNILDLSMAVLESMINSAKRSEKYLAPDFLAQCPCDGTQRGQPLTDEERERRKRQGEEMNNRLTQDVSAQLVIRSLLQQEQLLNGLDGQVVEEFQDEATVTAQEAAPGEESEEKQEIEETGEKHD
ncbi:hypothetical protein FBEOM_6609 [Fusarium beomiforme]|uniref:Uncharacterized protein n=1 Tax=Fusarium beomiforme TaxID=44412 RepID=A0A9P5AJE0_9HYPO|nr:hypothetical protein FBEOM_6609 [Fusarium beomiforme]